MQKLNHSPLPWKVVREPEYGTSTLIIASDKAHVASTAQPCYVSIPNDKTQKANTQLIVRAVNSHYELVEVCKKMLDMLRSGELIYADPKETLSMLASAIAKA